MRTFATGVFATVTIVCCAATARAQTPLPLTRDEAVRRGVAHAPRLAEAAARLAGAEAATTSRVALSRPNVSALAGYLRTNHVEEFGVPQAGGATRILFPDIPDNLRLRAEVQVPLYTGARVGHLLAAARGEARAVEADRLALEQDVRLEVVRAYWALVTTREQVRVLDRSLERTDAWVRDVRARVAAGVLPPNEQLTAEAQRARQAVRVVQARNAAEAAEIDLARLVGAAAGEAIQPVTPVTEAGAGADRVARLPVDRLAAMALAGRAERDGLERRRDALEAGAAAAGAAARPQVAAMAGVEPARPNPRFVPRAGEWRTSWDVGINVTWALFDGGRARADEAAARAQADAVTARLADFDALVVADVRQRRLEMDSGRAALAAADEAVRAAAEARRVIEERFRAGVATSTEVLDAEVAQLEAELDRTALAAGVRWSEARLLRAVGAL